jgi:hypothetical protein
LRGGLLPPLLLCAALGLALAFAPRRTWAPSVLMLLATSAAMIVIPIPQSWLERIFFSCWLSIVATAAAVHLRRGPNLSMAIALSVNAGIWSSAVVALGGSRLDLAKSLPWALILLPAAYLIARRAAIAVKVVSSWLIAVAILAATLQILPVTPGYLPDHLE